MYDVVCRDVMLAYTQIANTRSVAEEHLIKESLHNFHLNDIVQQTQGRLLSCQLVCIKGCVQLVLFVTKFSSRALAYFNTCAPWVPQQQQQQQQQRQQEQSLPMIPETKGLELDAAKRICSDDECGGVRESSLDELPAARFSEDSAMHGFHSSEEASSVEQSR